MHNAILMLENGQVFQGTSFGYEQSVVGEVVFNTAMTGYPESLTDPSYKGQLLVATYPLIGNYGIPQHETRNGIPTHFESDRIHISGLVISDYSHGYSHWNAGESLGQWLVRQKIPAIYGIDTRAVTRILRSEGSMSGKIIVSNQDIPWHDRLSENLVKQVSTSKVVVYGQGKYKILLVDCGVKYNIIRSLLQYDTTIVRVPWDFDYSEEDYDGLFISNGPGDPARCVSTIEYLRKALHREQPVFGICLGSQLLGLAAGGKTFKLTYGHRSHNQPVICHDNNRCYITSQNHGYAVDPDTLSDEWIPWFSNLNDHTCEGIRHKTKPLFSTQFHPEASGGPTDTAFLFEHFINEIIKFKTSRHASK